MKKDHTQYLRWIIGEINSALELNVFTEQIHSPIVYEDIAGRNGKIKQLDRLLVAAEIYRWIMGGKWRLLDLEHIIRLQAKKDNFTVRDVKNDMKHLIDNQELLNSDVLKMCLLLTGMREDLINDPKYVVQKRYFYTGNPNKLWSSIGYYDMKDRSIHVSTGSASKDNKCVFPLEDIVETAAHELGHHIYISVISRRFKSLPGTVRKLRGFLKGIKTSKSRTEHEQWLKFYKKDYSDDWEKNKALHIIPKNIYIRYGIESELFAQIISGKTTISKTKRKRLIDLINKSVLV